MPVPSFDRFIDPLLRVLGERRAPVRAREAHDAVATALGLTAEDRAELLPSGGQAVHANRNGWAHDRLKRAGLSQAVQRGVWQVTDAGLALLARHPGGLPPELVERIAAASAAASEADDDSPPAPVGAGAEAASPEELIDRSLRAIRESVATELLEMIGRESPAFFERLVLDLLHALGYGLSRAELQTVGGSGDGGIDGIISLDRLGLQKVYVQAKRWQSAVGGPVVRDFIGALTTRGADKGVLLTTSSFTAEAHATAERVRTGTIVLVDGRRLAELMIDHGVAVSHRALRVPRVDGDYFEA
jgi:restriction system protein